MTHPTYRTANPKLNSGATARHLDYVHFNPVKHGLMSHVHDWPYSSFRQCVARGQYPVGWLGNGREPKETGERR
jgi:putative transposase